LSDALELIAEAGSKLGFSRDDMSNLDYKYILNYKKKSSSSLKNFWKSKISYTQKKQHVNNLLVLPPLIFSKENFEIINYFQSQPNFITQKQISAKTIKLNSNSQILPNLENKLILIENADPGYDWIFTKNPKGLITKYGGIASHMAIRCAEIGLPASIGCGELLFEKLITSSKILLDCKNQQIIGLEYDQFNEMMEVKKTLKSLGYIK
jgi:phosphoenolpyruvate synthase/pyruvate phosphate dikinase